MEAVAQQAQEGLRDCGLSPCYAEARRALDAKSGQDGNWSGWLRADPCGRLILFVGWAGVGLIVSLRRGWAGVGLGGVWWGGVGWGGVGGRVGLGWGGVKSMSVSSHPMGPVHHILYVQYVYIVQFVCMQLCTYSTYSVCVEYLCVNVCV